MKKKKEKKAKKKRKKNKNEKEKKNKKVKKKKKQLEGEDSVKTEVVGTNGNIYYIHDGYKISVVQADIGICLAIGIKNKIKGDFTVLDYISNQIKMMKIMI